MSGHLIACTLTPELNKQSSFIARRFPCCWGVGSLLDVSLNIIFAGVAICCYPFLPENTMYVYVLDAAGLTITLFTTMSLA